MLQVLVSNRFEQLQEQLLLRLDQVPATPFVAQQIIVPSAAIQRAVTLGVSRRHGICANLEFSFLAQWLWRQIGRVVPQVSSQSPFAAPVMAWRVFAMLEDQAFVVQHSELARYLQGATPMMRYELAVRIAAQLEQYLTYRPHWLSTWAEGKQITALPVSAVPGIHQSWQAAIWRRIIGELGTDQEHPSSVFLRKVTAIGPDAPRQVGLPSVTHIVCLPSIPPLYLDLLRQLGRWIDLQLYLLNPCQEYWFDIVDRRRLSYLAAKGDTGYHELGHDLLARWGKQTQGLFDLVLGHEGEELVSEAVFVPNPADTLLAAVQNSILALETPVAGSLQASFALSLSQGEGASMVRPCSPSARTDGKPSQHGSITTTDRSLEVHVCHSLTREIEVLHNQLLAMFAAPNPPAPGDVLVVTPDLEAAAPIFDAVFGNAPAELRLPFSITGRARSRINAPARALLDILQLLSSRFAASAVFELLQQAIVARRYGFGSSELDLLREWIRESGIRWGIDAAHRARQDLPALARHSFSDGIDRLLLGYALPDGSDAAWIGSSPAGQVEGRVVSVLGMFVRVVDTLSDWQRIFAIPKSPLAWRDGLVRLLDETLEPADAELDDLRELRQNLSALHDNMQRGGFSGDVGLEVMQAALEAMLDDPARGGVPTGNITLTSMSSLRGLPYRVVCMIGMNDGAFPSTTAPSEFDLMAAVPSLGDRQRRDDERNLFLDLLLAARERLYLSYTGRNVRDNSVLLPSVLITELLDFVVPAIADTGDAVSAASVRKHLIVEHPLQPFSVRCFDRSSDSRLRSYQREFSDALKTAQARPVLPNTPAFNSAVSDKPGNEDETEDAQAIDDGDLQDVLQTVFFDAPLSPPEEVWRDVEMDTLMRFFRHPCRFLLRERLGLVLLAVEDELVDVESFVPDFSSRQALAERLLPDLLKGARGQSLIDKAMTGIDYPSGSLGRVAVNAELSRLAGFADALTRHATGPCLPPRTALLSVDLGTPQAPEIWRLTGAFSDLRPGGLVRHRYDDVRAGDYLSGWLSHLFLCALAPPGVALETHWLSRDGHYHLSPVGAAQEVLKTLLQLYRQGLSAPLHFFPKASWAFINYGENPVKAHSVWTRTSKNLWGESGDAYYRLALRGVSEPLNHEFAEAARQVFGAMRPFLTETRS